MPTPPDSPERVSISFRCGPDDDAARISAILVALGYDETRVVDLPAQSSAEVGVARVATKYRLNMQEHACALAIVKGAHRHGALATALDCDTRTAKWLRHTVHSKLNVDSDVGLHLAVLQALDGVAKPQQSKRPARPAPNLTRTYTRREG